MTLSPPVVDVCVLTWNNEALAPIALGHLVESAQDVAYRVLIRDNGSTDSTVAAVRAAAPDADIDAGTVNLGFAAGVNRIVARSSAPYVLILNSDAWPADHALDEMVRAAREHDDLVVVAPRLHGANGEQEHSTWPYPSLTLSALYATGLRRFLSTARAERMMLAPDWRHNYSRFVGWAVGAALLVPRAVLDQVGGFDERYFFYGEDVDWCWRVTDAGFRIWFESAAVVDHVGGASSADQSQATISSRKAAASALLMTRRRGRLIGSLFRALEILIAVRIGAIGAVKRDRGTLAWARSVIDAQLHPVSRQARPLP